MKYVIKAGSGGNESQDWAQMLVTIYMRWAARNEYRLSVNSIHSGVSAGIVSAAFEVECPPEMFDGEIGTHRLTRISPFDPERRRHTSFAELKLNDGAKRTEDMMLASQIRSYVLSPYRLVKDTRTKLEITDVNAVLEGHIEPFIEAYQRFAQTDQLGGL